MEQEYIDVVEYIRRRIEEGKIEVKGKQIDLRYFARDTSGIGYIEKIRVLGLNDTLFLQAVAIQSRVLQSECDDSYPCESCKFMVINAHGNDTCEFRFSLSRQVVEMVAPEYLPLIRKASAVNKAIDDAKNEDRKRDQAIRDYASLVRSFG